MSYLPPYTITPRITHLVAQISEAIGGYYAHENLRLHRVNRIQTILGTLAIEGNTLSAEQVTAVLEGKPIVAPLNEVQEVRNAIRAYELLDELDPYRMEDLLRAHATMEAGLIDDAGQFRRSGAGVVSGEQVIHYAPDAERVPFLMQDLFMWLQTTEEHPLIASCVFHYEFEFIHPFSDGNGRIGRLWHTAIMASWIPEMAWVPVESVVRERQSEYYSAIATSTMAADSGPFIDFMLEAIRDALDDVAKSSGTFAIALNPTEDHLLGMIRSGTYANASMAAEALSVSERTIFRALKSLKEKGLIVREGTDKTGVWRAT